MKSAAHCSAAPFIRMIESHFAPLPSYFYSTMHRPAIEWWNEKKIEQIELDDDDYLVLVEFNGISLLLYWVGSILFR